MNLIEHLFSLVLANSAITEIVGGNIYPANLPEDPATPFLEFQTVHTEHWEDSDGSAGVAMAVVQFDALATVKGDVLDLIEAVRKQFCAPMFADTVIQESSVDDGPYDLDEDLTDGAGRKIFRTVIRLQFIYNNSGD